MGRNRFVGVVALAALLSAGCGSEPSVPAAGGPDPTMTVRYPSTIDSANGPVELDSARDAIVSLSPTATEILFAIDAGDRVVAADDNSTYPSEAPTTELSGFDPNVEAIAAYEPDLVVYSFDPGGLEKGLDKLGIPALFQPAAMTIEDTYDQIQELGVATAAVDEADELVAQMDAEIDELVDSVSAPEDTTYYYELDDTYYSLTSETFVGQLFEPLGLENIADAADKDGSGYPQLSAEYIVKADPDVIFLADTKCCDQSAATVAARPGWKKIAAVENDAIVELDDDVASRWGPRVVELLRAAVDALVELGA